jgi:hypothetical protein
MHSTSDHPCVTGRADAEQLPPIAVTVRRACQLTGLGPTTIWNFLRDGRLGTVRVPGLRRTLVSYSSLAQLLAPPSLSSPAPRRRGRPPKLPRSEGGP